MVRLIYYQYHYYQKQWLGTIPVFLVAGLIIGLSLNGVFSIQTYHLVFEHKLDPTPIFLFPIFFGGLSLFLIVSNLIRFLMAILSKDFERWKVLGASRLQLSCLTAGQLGLIAGLSALVGYLLSVPLTGQYYDFLQYFFGKDLLPEIQITADFRAFFGTLLLVTSLSFGAGLYYSYQQMTEPRAWKRWLLKLWAIVSKSFLILVWGATIWGVIIGKSLLDKAQFVFLLLLVQVGICYLLTPGVQLFLLRALSQVMNRFYASLVAYHTLQHEKVYLKSLNSSMLVGITLLTGFQILSQNIFALFQEDADLEMKVSIVIYLGTPLVIVFANVIAITILASYQERHYTEQLRVLGVSKKQLVLIKVWEALSHTLLIFIVSTVLNLVIWGLTVYMLWSTGYGLAHVSGFASSLPVIGVLLFTLILLTKLSNEFEHFI
ncbi:FtsX-like permease family protein [Streptococcus merionis]|uniref:FtsX-like permease family protein n=1 Tax=Streptococcus merionis TaxID=400065 RepID=UPI0035161C3B